MSVSAEPADSAVTKTAIRTALFAGASIQATEIGEKIEVVLLMARLASPVLSDRATEVKRCFKRWMAREHVACQFEQSHACLMPAEQPKDMRRRLREIDERLSKLIDAPISPKAVERHLGISGRERNKWMKDGRLPSNASRRSSRAQGTFRVPYYPARIVCELRETPEVIQAWRNRDKLNSVDCKLDGVSD